MNELFAAIKWYGSQPCHFCGQPLGDRWAERYDAATDRLIKAHLAFECPTQETS